MWLKRSVAYQPGHTETSVSLGSPFCPYFYTQASGSLSQDLLLPLPNRNIFRTL